MRSVAISIVLLVIASAAPAALVAANPVSDVTGIQYVPRPPIRVDGDESVLVLAASGVTGGDGSAENPYVIENWEIGAQTLGGALGEDPNVAGIRIVDVTKHVIVREVCVHDFEFGIYLENARHVTIEKAALSGALRSPATPFP